MNRFIDKIGKRYGKLTVLKRGENKGTTTMWHCLCDCGNTTIVRRNNLQSKHTRSCGCLKVIINRKINSSHKKSKTPIYNIWACMKARCYNQHNIKQEQQELRKLLSSILLL